MNQNLNGVYTRKKKQKSKSDVQLKLANNLIDNDPAKAIEILDKLSSTETHNPLVWVLLGKASEKTGSFQSAYKNYDRALLEDPYYVEALYAKANLLFDEDKVDDAEVFLENSIGILKGKDTLRFELLLAAVYQKLKKYELSLGIYQALTKREPDNWLCWNNMGMIYQDLADYTNMELAYKKSCSISGTNMTPYFNYIVGSHYNPTKSAEEILEISKAWQEKFDIPVSDNYNNKAVHNKTLKIGMISDGFRAHPVGHMITLGLSHINNVHIQFYAYSTNFFEDHVTKRLKNIVSGWRVVASESDEKLASIIKNDGIDILFDLCGYNANSRMKLFMNRPAPIQIKWVGGLISSTGLKEMDYLLSDNYETPEGAEVLYTEKLIRLPGDYICYDPPPYLPSIKPSPLMKNGYVTFGCFNNAAKINDELLKIWACILNEVPNSRLYLKSFSFRSAVVRERVCNTLESNGVSRERILIEGDSKHKELLESYNRIDIALDPWPYSGGLTTCEAMVMGVPVITMPGPTFAGRHSASHLINAGMPEFVAENWMQYIKLAVELSNDINSLSVIRKHLRQNLLLSPVCDSKAFSYHFSNAMRAIWQRYCEGKGPEGLTINADGNPYFHDSNEIITLQHPLDTAKEVDEDFSFEILEKFLLVDYGARFAREGKIISLLSSNIIRAIIFDPLGIVHDGQLPVNREFTQYIPLHLLGDGDTAPIYMCLDESYSSDLKPVSSMSIDSTFDPKKIIAEINATNSRLDDVEGLESIDWLVLDNIFNLNDLFKYGRKSISACLVIDVRCSLNLTHVNQMAFDTLLSRMKDFGFDYYDAVNNKVISNSSKTCESPSAGGVDVMKMIFIPNRNRLLTMNTQIRERLAFILHSAYKLYEIAFNILSLTSTDRALKYANFVHDNFGIVIKDGNDIVVDVIPNLPHMSENEIRLFERIVGESGRYFEFGSGGSTKLVARHNLAVYGVESDLQWTKNLKKETGCLCKVEYVNIGPTKEWGYPIDNSSREKFPLYSESILNYEEAFDLILVDGRFRVACTLNAIKHTILRRGDLSKTIIFIHDFWNRPAYHLVLDFLDLFIREDSAGAFKIKSGIDMKYINKLLGEYKYIAD
ncbi:hypothetical protein V8Z79_08130 [Pantoea dispersa]|uniref:O-linked N-acetylglucosamine transferase, SPINDLY family protein n=1 Tax=Pantoea dispersa TaxID=59814 RepID=UPI0030D5DCBD